jgi:hypothetical protein
MPILQHYLVTAGSLANSTFPLYFLAKPNQTKKLHLFLLLFFSSILLYSHIRKNNLALKFLESLNKEQHDFTQHDFKDQNRFQWHYLPATQIERPGIQLAALDAK